jgi:hypothetical protein
LALKKKKKKKETATFFSSQEMEVLDASGLTDR